MSVIYQLDSEGIRKLCEQMAASLRSGADVRGVQGQNAQQAKFFDQPGVATTYPTEQGGVFPAVTGNQVFFFRAAINRSINFFQAIIVFDQASGSGRWRCDGPAPLPTVGAQVPAGGTVLTIPGLDNIANFKLIAEAGQTLTFASYLFI